MLSLALARHRFAWLGLASATQRSAKQQLRFAKPCTAQAKQGGALRRHDAAWLGNAIINGMRMRICKLDQRGEMKQWDVEVVERGKAFALIAHHDDLGEVMLAEGKKDDVMRALDAHLASVREHNSMLTQQARSKLAIALGMTNDELDAFLRQCTAKPVHLRRGWVMCVQGAPDAVIPQCESVEQAALIAANILRLNESDVIP